MPEEKDEFGGVALAETDEFGGEALDPSPETLASTAVQVPQAITSTVSRLFELGAPGSEAARAQSERERQAQTVRAVAAGGGPMAGMAQIPPVVTPPQVGAAFRYGLTIPGRVANAILTEERLAGGQGIAAPPEPAFGEPKEEYEQRVKYPLGAPGEPLYIPQTDQPSDVQKWASSMSTIDDFLSVPLATTRTGARVMLAAMLPGVATQVEQIAAGPGDAQDKLERARALVVPALIALQASKPRGMQLRPGAPDFRGEPVDQPLPLTGGEALLNRPRGALPPVRPVPRAAELVGPPPPRRGLPVEVPETAAGEQPTILEEIRAKNAQTREQIRELFPQLSREEAGQIRNLVWGKPGEAERVGVVVSPTIPRPTPMEPPRPTVAPPPAPPRPEPLTGELTPAELEQQARDRGAIGQQIITWERELDKAIKTGDQSLRSQAINKLLQLREAYEGPERTAQIKPKPPLARLPAEPTVPGTGAEPRETAISEIRRKGARTVGEIQRLFPERGLSREDARALRNQAWGAPPEEPPPAAPPAAPAPVPPPAPPVAPAAAAEKPPVAELAPDAPGKARNTLGDPLGTTYHATPEDWAAWQRLQKLTPKERFQPDNFQQQEDLKNKYGGMAPEPPKETAIQQQIRQGKEILEQLPPSVQEPLTESQKARLQQRVKKVLSPTPKTAADFAALPPEQFNPWKKSVNYGDPTAAEVTKDFTAEDIPTLERARDEQRAIVDRLQRDLERATAQNNQAEQERIFNLISSHGLKAQTLNEFVRAMRTRTPAPAPPAAEPAAPKTIEETPIAGKTLGEWEAVRDASGLPKGDARAELAKFLAVPNQPSRILQALANKKRTREIHAPPAPIEEAAPPAEPTAPAAGRPPEGELFNVPQAPRTGAAARSYIIRRLEELEDIDPQTGEAFPKEDLTDAQEKARKKYRERLAEIEGQIAAREAEVTAAAAKAAKKGKKPTKAPPKPVEAEPAEPTVAQLWKQVDEPEDGVGITAQDAANAIMDMEAGTTTEPLVKAAQDYLDAIDEDMTEYGGRSGLAEEAQDRFLKALEQEAGETPSPPETKPAAPETKPPVSETKPPVVETEAPPAAKTQTAKERPSLPQPSPEAEILGKKAREERAKLEEMVSRLNEQARRAQRELRPGTPEYEADQEAGQKLSDEIEEQRKITAKAEADFMDARIEGEFRQYRGKPQPEPSEPKITNKVLKAQKEDLMGQLNQAIKDAPAGRGTEKITIQVEGDGEFTLFNGKEALTKFRDEHAKFFPETVGGTGTPKLPPAKGKAIPKLTQPAANDLPKIAGLFVSDDPSRFVLQTSYADGTQIISTDGRQMLRIVGPSPGTPAAPVRLTPEGKIDTEATGKYPNYNQVRPTDPTLVKSGASTDEIWKLARQAQVFLKGIEVQGEPYRRMDLFINKDGSLGAKSEFAEVGSFEHNVKPDAYFLGTYNADYIANGVEAARRLGNEKIDLYAADTTGPLVMVGKNHEYTLMAMRMGEGADIRQAPDAAPRPGPPEHRRPPEGYGPLGHPEEYNARQVEPAGGQKFNVIYEGGEFKIQQFHKGAGKYGSYGYREDRWEDIATVPFDREKGLPPKMPEISAALEAGLKRKPNASEQTKVRSAMEELIKDRQNVIEEGKRRTQNLAGPGTPSIYQGPDPEVVGLDAGSRRLNRIQRGYQNFFEGLRQLWARRGQKVDIQQLANAAENMPRLAGLAAGESIRLRARTEAAQVGLTSVLQALKMSGDRLSIEAADRLGQLEFAGDPIGYLRTKQADMETLAQQYLNEGKKLEAQAAIDDANSLKYAREHFNELRPIAELYRKKTDLQHRRLANAGIDVAYENWYVPQRHEIDLFTAGDRPIVLGHTAAGGPSGAFKKAKVYEDYPSAIEAGFVPRTLNAADLLEHYVAQTERQITKKAFFDNMREVADPVDRKPLVMDIPTRVIERPDGSLDRQESIPLGYKPMQVLPGVRVAVHEGYSRLIDALTSTSQIAESAAVGTLQDIAAVEKHIGLALDTFHASRVMQAELALTHRVSLGARQRLGRALVEYSLQDLDAAVSAGEISQEMADWIRTPQRMMVNGREVAITPKAMLTLGIKNGVNLGRFGDAIYRQWLREIPITGTVNKWVFDKLTRSAMAHGFLAEFERVAAARPELTAVDVAKQVARDINVLFGNLQKESIFRNPSLNSIMQILFLAPRWVESLARREGRAIAQIGEAGVRLAQGKPAAIGSVGKSVGTGLAFYFAGTQLLNLITRQQLTFQNKERGHKLDAWIPGGKNGFFVSPLSVFAEISHDILRYAETKPDIATALTQIGANKLGNLGRFLEVIALGRDPLTSEKIIGTGRRAVRAGLQLVPVPITLSQGVRTLAAKTGLVEPPPPGAFQRQALASIGFKTEPAGTAQSQIFRLVDDWKSNSDNAKYRAEVERRQKEDFGPSDYQPLRNALNRNDLEAARRAYQDLRQAGKTPKVIRQTMAHPHPFTGSAAAESRFKASLNPDERELYNKAIEERRQLYHKFQQMLATPNQ